MSTDPDHSDRANLAENGDLRIALAAAKEVLAHLNEEVEKLTSTVDKLEREKDALRSRFRALSKQLALVRPKPDAVVGIADEHQEKKVDLSADGYEMYSMEEWDQMKAIANSNGLLIEPEEVVLGETLGEGTFAVIKAAVFRSAPVAVKCCHIDSREHAEMFAREVHALRLVRHPNLVGLYAVCITPPAGCWMVCERLDTTLAQWLYGPGMRPRYYSLAEKLKKLSDIAKGMQALEQHSPPILHRDLKPSNVLLCDNGTAKVSDFGLSRVLSSAEMVASLTGETGSYLYMSPECIRHEPYSSSTDVWSFGVLAVEVFSQQKPYAHLHMLPVQLALAVSEGQIKPEPPSDLPEPLTDMILGCTEYDPINRPSFAIIESILRSTLLAVNQSLGTHSQKDTGVLNRWFGT